MTHTSGLARELPAYYWNDLKFPSREEMMRIVPTEPAVFTPETEYKYSNLALDLALDNVFPGLQEANLPFDIAFKPLQSR